MTEETINTSNEVLKKKKNSIYKNWKIKLASIPVIIFILLGIFGPLIMNFDPLETYTDQRLLSPGTPLKDGSIAYIGRASCRERDYVSLVLLSFDQRV